MSHHVRRALLPALLALPLLLSLAPAAATEQDDAGHERGRDIFLEGAEPPCAICHRLADAGAEGTIGPSLDELRPTEERVMAALRSGPGAMPDYSEILSDEEMEAVAEYVASVTGGS